MESSDGKTNKRKINTGRIVKISLVVLVVTGLCVALALAVERQKSYRNELEGIYQKSYFDTMDSMNNVESKLKKLSVTDTPTIQKTLLNDVWRGCETAQANLSQLSGREESVNEIIKFLNQLGDYCYFLSMKLEEPLDEADTARLEKLTEIVSQLVTELQSVRAQLMQGGNLVGAFNTNLNFVSDALAKIKHSTIDYPELIYDGPFSDGLNDREAKALKGLSELSPEQADAKVKALLPEAEIVSRSEVDGSITAYMYEVKYNGKNTWLQITKKGGLLVFLNTFSEVSPNLSEDECIEKAKQFLVKAGYEGLEPVWSTNNNSTVYVNFAYMIGDVIVYPDLIKLKVSATDGEILGFEAQNYIYNHTERTIQTPHEISYKPAAKLKIVEENFALIPTEWNTEVLTKEFKCEFDGETYYIYYDLEKKQEIKVLVVIEEEGKLLI